MSRRDLRSQIPVLGDYKRQKLLLLRQARGIPSTVDAGPVLAHLDWLTSLGFSGEAIGAAAGLPPQTIWLMRKERPRRTHIERASRIMAITHVPVAAQSGAMVPAVGTRRRLQALQAIGHPLSRLGEDLGVTGEAVRQYTRHGAIRGATWEKIRDLYERKSGSAGGNARIAGRARRLGYLPPLAWEGLDIDHPDQLPVKDVVSDKEVLDPVLLARILKGAHKGDVPKLERDAVMDYAVEHGWSGTKVAEILGIRTDSASRAIVKHRRKNARVAS